MASRARSKTPKEEDEVKAPEPASSDPQLVDINYYARFQHGSPDSRDVDMVYIVPADSTFPLQTTLVNFCKQATEDRNVIQLGLEIGTSSEWFVKKSFRGAPDEVNNAVWETHRKVPGDTPCTFEVQQKCARSVILRYVVAAKAVIIKMRRIESCRKACLDALWSWNFERNLSAIHGACKASFDQIDKESAKYITFHFAQSYALSQGVESYSKKSLVGLLPQIRSIIYFEGESDSTIDAEQVLIIKNLEELWHRQAERIFSKPIEGSKYLHSYHIRGTQAVSNYLEADCTGIVIDMQTERICLAPAPLKFATSIETSEKAAPSAGMTLQYPPTWPIDSIADSSLKEDDQGLKLICIGFFDGKLLFSEHDTSSGNQTNSSKNGTATSSKKSNPANKTHKSKSVLDSTSDENTKFSELKAFLATKPHPLDLQKVNITVYVKGTRIVGIRGRSTLSLKLVDVVPTLGRFLD